MCERFSCRYHLQAVAEQQLLCEQLKMPLPMQDPQTVATCEIKNNENSQNLYAVDGEAC